MNCLDWYGCYNARWGGVIAKDAIRHPAKFSCGLIERVYRHLRGAGSLRLSDTVLNPFGGVALGAWPALRQGVNWVDVELEPHFVDLGRANLDLWQRRYAARFPQWGQAMLLPDDSRRLSEVFGQVETQTAGQLGNLPEGSVTAVISSPPYEGSANQHPSANDAEARLKRMHKAGIDVSQLVKVSGPNGSHYTAQAYGNTSGQMGATKGETFWEAARLVVEQCHALLKPGGIAVLPAR